MSYRPHGPGQTQFLDNRTGLISQDPLFSWETQVDKEGRTYYIDHFARQNSYCHPLKLASWQKKKEVGTLSASYRDCFKETTADGREYSVFPETGGATAPESLERKGLRKPSKM
jgi:hypothetical protein